jgi:hypothetical protein
MKTKKIIGNGNGFYRGKERLLKRDKIPHHVIGENRFTSFIYHIL